MNGHILAPVVALLLTACGSSSSSPTPITPTTPGPTAGTTNWKVTQRFVSVTGPDNCWVREQRERLTGAVFPELPMAVARTAGSITLQGEFFQVNYAGTISGVDFSASGVQLLEGGGRPCDGTSFQQMPGVSTLAGRFSADDLKLTATEMNAYRLTSGEPVTYTWAWEATR